MIHGVEGGIDPNSVNPDVIDANRRNLSMAERRLLLGVAKGAWRPS